MRNECQVSLSNVMVPRMPPRKYKQILIEDMKILFRILQFEKLIQVDRVVIKSSFV